MAEIINNNINKKGKRVTRRNTRVDLTPMVDLGFLLITFFVFTTTMNEKKVMDAMLPDDTDTSINDPVCESCALTFIAGKNDTLFYYEGMQQNAVYKTTSYAGGGLRKLIMEKKKRVIDLMQNDKLVMIIKPTSESNFKNLVNIIDEAAICRVKRYYIAELSESDRKILQ